MIDDEIKADIQAFAERARTKEFKKLTYAESTRFFAEWQGLQTRLERFITEKAQADGTFPVGFLPSFHYDEGKGEAAKIQENLVRVRITDDGGVRRRNDDLLFFAEGFKPENLPALPLRGHGEIWTVGWDIPTRWAVDALGRAWADNAHGGAMDSCTPDSLLSEARESPNSLVTLHKLLGRKPPLPEWARAALSAGWTPPKDFDRSEYEG